jgi:hypothetical protein
MIKKRMILFLTSERLHNIKIGKERGKSYQKNEEIPG